MRDELDPDVDDFEFGDLVTEQRLAQWQSAAASTGASFEDFVTTWLDAAASAIERTAESPNHPDTKMRFGTSPSADLG